ncbi:MAG: hypothetical protein Q4G04_04470 [bacterium]|nr:hypothetical protein [bacterium]
MDKIKKYNIFIFISTFARNMIEVLSIIILYKQGFSLTNILFFFALIYFFGSIVSYLTIKLLKYIKVNYILILSSIIYGISIYYLSNIDKRISSLIILSFLYSLGSYIYHTIRHYYALHVMPNAQQKKAITKFLILSYIAVIPATYIGAYLIDTIGLMYISLIIIVISIIGIIPLIRLKITVEEAPSKIILTIKSISKGKFLFFIIEQFKVIFLTLQPLYLFLYVDNSLEYIGIFNIFIGIASVVFIYFFNKKVSNKYYYLYIIIFCLVLILKINLNNKHLLLFIAFVEGLGIKMYESISTQNLYNFTSKNNIKGYIIVVELIFCLTRGLITLLAILINDIKLILYICIFFIFISCFIIKKAQIGLNN